MSWLVTGGAGYIGAHVVRSMIERGWNVVVLDDLSTGVRSFVPASVPFVQASLTDEAAVRAVLSDHDVTGVVHLGGLKYAGVSVREPLAFYQANVEGTRVLLEQCDRHGVQHFVFSSSASVYGTPTVGTVTEQTPTGPESPYGQTKLIGEWLVADLAEAQRLRGESALRHTSLRYFNVVGSDHADVWDASPHNLFPLVREALREGRPVTVHGDDYPTPDGTCVRDYLHVQDVAEAHVSAAEAMEAGRAVSPCLNLGRGEGVSVREVLQEFGRALGRDVEVIVGPRRPGDPARIVADPTAARTELQWRAQRDLADMVRSSLGTH